jgi:hypothetical protein
MAGSRVGTEKIGNALGLSCELESKEVLKKKKQTQKNNGGTMK